MGYVRGGLAILNRHMARGHESRRHYEAALAVYREAGDRRSEGIALGNRANLLIDQGPIDEGEQHLLAALAIMAELRNI